MRFKVAVLCSVTSGYIGKRKSSDVTNRTECVKVAIQYSPYVFCPCVFSKGQQLFSPQYLLFSNV